MAFLSLQERLFVTNPTLSQVLNLWHRDYAKVRLVNPVMLLTHPNVMDLSAYQSAVMKDIESVRMLLLKKYVMCITIEKEVSGQALLGGSLRCRIYSTMVTRRSRFH